MADHMQSPNKKESITKPLKRPLKALLKVCKSENLIRSKNNEKSKNPKVAKKRELDTSEKPREI
jgi:hypothetical protein